MSEHIEPGPKPETVRPIKLSLLHLVAMPSLPDNVFLLPVREEIPDDAA